MASIKGNLSQAGNDIKYEIFAKKMEQLIRNKEYASGHALPTIRRLMNIYSLGNATVVKGMELLKQRGLIEHHPNRGYFVSSPGSSESGICQICLIESSLKAETDVLATGVRDILGQDDGYSLSVYSTNSNIEVYQKTINQMAKIRPAGVILSNMPPDIYKVDMSPLAGSGIPVVALGERVDGFSCDRVDYRGRLSAQKIGQYLLERGNTDFAFLSTDSPKDYSRREFVEFFRRMLAEKGLSLPDERIYKFSNSRGFSSQPDPYIDAQERMQRIIDSGDTPEVVICCHDYTAVGALRAILAAGLKIPQDIQVISISTSFPAVESPMRLTTIDVHHGEWGRVAAELLLKRMDGYDGENEVHYIASDLIVGETTK